ncbi:hypothetical protein BRPE64_ECDS00310 (plasmid) [Caballeronia insecticola]|uniref:Uncharacterized protein n=1 Tax=Caballeronia insecticola TaxID=758793 RepID=R4WUF6_9BURK|nr:hypothetical protein BRPE64_ECDS00310 [Caballeronia insecticola]
MRWRLGTRARKIDGHFEQDDPLFGHPIPACRRMDRLIGLQIIGAVVVTYLSPRRLGG